MVDPDLIADTVLARVVDNHVLNHLHPLGMSRVDEILIGSIRRFQTGIHLVPVIGVITVIIETRAVLHRRCYPNGGKAQILDVIELFDQPLEVATPVGITRLVTITVVVVIAGIPIIEASRQYEVDGLTTEIRCGR